MRAWEKNIRKVTPYTPGEQPARMDIIKLNTNENPYPPSPNVTEALNEMKAGDLRRYPDPEARELTKAIAEAERVRPEQIFCGAGSDEVLAFGFLTFFNGNQPILFPDITYSFYDVWADLFRISYERVPLNDRLEIVPGDYDRPNGGVVFPNPNAPTGVLMGVEAVEEILRHNPDVITIVDEAYIDFGGTSCTGLLERYDNLVVVKTFSKSRAMAGMRIGYAVANEPLIRALKDVKDSFNSYTMSRAAIALGTAAVKDREYFKKTCLRIQKTRETAKKKLVGLGFSFPDSMANFLFVTHGSIPASELFAALTRAGIYVRHFDQPRIDNYLRITVGTDEQMEKLYAFLKGYLREDYKSIRGTS